MAKREFHEIECGCWWLSEWDDEGQLERLELRTCPMCMGAAWAYLDDLWVDVQGQLTLPLPSRSASEDNP